MHCFILYGVFISGQTGSGRTDLSIKNLSAYSSYPRCHHYRWSQDVPQWSAFYSCSPCQHSVHRPLSLWHHQKKTAYLLSLYLHRNADGNAEIIMSVCQCATYFFPQGKIIYQYQQFHYLTCSSDNHVLLLLLTAGTLLCKLLADLTSVPLQNFTTLYLLHRFFFPFYWFCIILSMCCNYQIKFNFYFLVILALSVPVIPVFLRGIRNIHVQEKNRILREKQIELLKEQLDFFNDMETEYQNLRKWNHDIENHLLFHELSDAERKIRRSRSLPSQYFQII